MDVRSARQLLALDGNEPLTRDRLRRAYLRTLRQFPPERDPDGFRRLRQAFELLERFTVAAPAATAPVTAPDPERIAALWRDQVSAHSRAGAEATGPAASVEPPEATAPDRPVAPAIAEAPSGSLSGGIATPAGPSAPDGAANDTGDTRGNPDPARRLSDPRVAHGEASEDERMTGQHTAGADRDGDHRVGERATGQRPAVAVGKVDDRNGDAEHRQTDGRATGRRPAVDRDRRPRAVDTHALHAARLAPAPTLDDLVNRILAAMQRGDADGAREIAGDWRRHPLDDHRSTSSATALRWRRTRELLEVATTLPSSLLEAFATAVFTDDIEPAVNAVRRYREHAPDHIAELRTDLARRAPMLYQRLDHVLVRPRPAPRSWRPWTRSPWWTIAVLLTALSSLGRLSTCASPQHPDPRRELDAIERDIRQLDSEVRVTTTTRLELLHLAPGFSVPTPASIRVTGGLPPAALTAPAPARSESQGHGDAGATLRRPATCDELRARAAWLSAMPSGSALDSGPLNFALPGDLARLCGGGPR